MLEGRADGVYSVQVEVEMVVVVVEVEEWLAGLVGGGVLVGNVSDVTHIVTLKRGRMSHTHIHTHTYTDRNGCY